MIDTAVILAAGLGTRLRDEVADVPKGFLRLGEQTIIEESIGRLAAAGIQDILIVTGYCADHYERLAARHDGLVRTVHNPSFAASGSMYSLYCGRGLIDRDFLLLESDLIFEPRALACLLDHPSPDGILVSGATHAGDEVYVATRDGLLVDMSKNRASLAATDDTEVTGELVGICKISVPLFDDMQQIAAMAFADSLYFDYETDCLVAAGRLRSIACPLVADLVWAEIDDPAHLRRARDEIYPEICRRVNASGVDRDGNR